MAYQFFRMDTTNMSADHRSVLLERISKSDGSWFPTNEQFVFKLMWDNEKDDFQVFIPYANECALTPWGIY